MSEEVVKGLGDLQQYLDQLPAKVERNVLRGAMRAAAKVPLAAAQADVPVETGGKHPGALKASLKIKTSSRGGIVKAVVAAGGKSAFWALWVERGTKPHEIKPKARKSLFFAGLMKEIVQHPGAKANPFMLNALTKNVQAALDAAGAYIRNRLATKEGIDVPGPENY